MPPVAALTHRHLLAVLADEVSMRNLERPTILDAGCGRGVLTDHLTKAFQDSRVCGFDSHSYGQIEVNIGEGAPGAECREVLPDGRWPFTDESVDIVVSNQVIEHVMNIEQFCSENFRVLRPGGFGLHVFPTQHSLVEFHMRLPLVHHIRSHDVRAKTIQSLAPLGPDRSLRRWENAIAHADYTRLITRYRTWREICDEYHRHGFRVSYRHSLRLLERAMSRALGREVPGGRHPPFVEALAFPLVRATLPITVIVEKEQTYTWKPH